MEKMITTKRIRLFALTTTVILLALMGLQIPYANAKYVEPIANINTALSEVTEAQADNLFIHLMNEMYPMWSIYMTTEIDDVEVIKAHFGGDWEAWGQGRVPMGSADNAPLGAPGGSMNGAPSNIPVTISGLQMQDLNTISLSTPTMPSPWLTDNGGIDWSADVTLSSAAAPANTFGGRRELLSNHIPLHNHGATTKLTWYNTWYNGGGSTTMNAWDRATSTGSPLSLGTHTGTAAPGANVAPYWGVAVANFTRTTQYAPISTEFIVDKDKLKAAITSPSGTINDPSLTGNTNQAVSDATGLSAVASGTINGATDNTLQPYITCYMYRRTALGKLN